MAAAWNSLQSEVVETHNTLAPAVPSRPPSVPYLARGAALPEAVRRAKTYITGALRHSLQALAKAVGRWGISGT